MHYIYSDSLFRIVINDVKFIYQSARLKNTSSGNHYFLATII